MTTSETESQTHAGVRWTAIGVTSIRVSRFVANAVLARLLLPESFGLIEMANAAIVMMAALREAGIGQAYIQRLERPEDRPREAIDTVFAYIVALNGLLAVALFWLSPLIAGVFEDDAAALEPVVRAMAALFLLDSFVATPQFLLQRRMNFDKIALSELSGAIGNAAVAIGAALLGAGVWSLVIGQVADRVVTGASLSIRAAWRPGLTGSWRMARELLSYGKFLWGYSLVRAAGGIIDKAVIGRLFGASELGGYGLAFKTCMLPATAIAQLVNRVALPALSRMQEDHRRLERAFLKSVSHVSFLAIPTGVGLIAVSDLFVPVVFGERWSSIVPIVDVLGLYGILLATASVCGPALQALGRPQFFLYTEVCRQIALIGLIYLLASRGEVGVAWAVLGALATVTVPAFWLVARDLEIRASRLIAPIARCSAASLAMYFAVSLVRRGSIPVESQVLDLSVAVVTGIISYVGSSAILNRRLLGEVLRTMRAVSGK